MANTVNSDVIGYLERRGLDPELAVRMGWGAGQTQGGEALLKIPHVRDGEVVGVKVRKIADGQWRWAPERKAAELWNVDALYDATLKDEPVVITEGQFDALACIQAGFVRSLSVPDGWTEGLTEASGDRVDDSGPKNGKTDVLDRHAKALNAAPAVIIASDDDVTGWCMLQAASNILDPLKLRFLKYPKGCKDANDVLRERGEAELRRVLSSAPYLDPPGGLITGFGDAPPQVPKTLYRLGMQWFDERSALQTRELSVLTGRPGSGKTTFVCWMIDRFIRRYPEIKIALAAFETDAEELLNNFSLIESRALASDREPEAVEALKQRLDRSIRLLHRAKARHLKLESAHGLRWLKDMIHAVALRDGCKIIIIDPRNELEHMPEPGESLTAYTNFALMRLRQFAEDYDVHVMIVAHPRKLQDREVPMGYHISDSAAWANKAGLGITLQPNEDDFGSFVELWTWKARDQPRTQRRVGKTDLMFARDTSSYFKRDKFFMSPETKEPALKGQQTHSNDAGGEEWARPSARAN